MGPAFSTHTKIASAPPELAKSKPRWAVGAKRPLNLTAVMPAEGFLAIGYWQPQLRFQISTWVSSGSAPTCLPPGPCGVQRHLPILYHNCRLLNEDERLPARLAPDGEVSLRQILENSTRPLFNLSTAPRSQLPKFLAG